MFAQRPVDPRLRNSLAGRQRFKILRIIQAALGLGRKHPLLAEERHHVFGMRLVEFNDFGQAFQRRAGAFQVSVQIGLELVVEDFTLRRAHAFRVDLDWIDNFGTKRLEMAKHQCTGPIAAGNFDLRYGLPRVHGQNQSGQRFQLPGDARVQHMAGLHIPVQPMEHHYLLTDRIDAVAEFGSRLPCGIDYEANIYFRQERDGMLLGTYEPVGTPWKVAGTPWDFGHELLNDQFEKIEDSVAFAYRRFPVLERAGVKSVIHGP